MEGRIKIMFVVISIMSQVLFIKLNLSWTWNIPLSQKHNSDVGMGINLEIPVLAKGSILT